MLTYCAQMFSSKATITQVAKLWKLFGLNQFGYSIRFCWFFVSKKYWLGLENAELFVAYDINLKNRSES